MADDDRPYTIGETRVILAQLYPGMDPERITSHAVLLFTNDEEGALLTSENDPMKTVAMLLDAASMVVAGADFTPHDYEVTEMSVAEPVLGMQMGSLPLRHHPASACAGRNCCIHNPSDHPMRDWPLNWRGDIQIMERKCPHGVGHDDPDDRAYRISRYGKDNHRMHGSCPEGCCQRFHGNP